MLDKGLAPDSVSSSYWRLIDWIYETGRQPENWSTLLYTLFQHIAVLSRDNEVDEGAEQAFHDHLQGLLEHAGKALQLHSRFDSARIAEDEVSLVLEQIPVALLFVSQNKLTHMSGKARAYLDNSASVIIDDTRITDHQIEHVSLEKALLCLTALPESERYYRPYVLMLPDNKDPLAAYLFPLDDQNALQAVVLFEENDILTIPDNLFKDAFDLTGAESRVLARIINGSELNDISHELSVSVNTLRSQLKSIFSKTGLHRQTDLVKLGLCGASLYINEQPSNTKNKILQKSKHGNRQEQTITLPDGRQLGYAEFGDPDGKPVILQHNIIGSRLQIPGNEQFLHDLGVRVILPDRPGYGLSDDYKKTSLLSFAQDTECLADQLKLDQFHMLGSSMGAVYTAACAYRMPDRLLKSSLISCMPKIQDLKKAYPLLSSHRAMLSIARFSPAVFKMLLEFALRNGSEAYLDKLVCERTEADRRLYNTPTMREMMITAFGEITKRNGIGVVRDITALVNDWGFSLEDVQARMQIWHGDNDVTAPVSLLQPSVKKMQNAEVSYMQGETHWLFFRHWHTMLTALVDEPCVTTTDQKQVAAV